MHCEVLCIKQLEAKFPKLEDRLKALEGITAYVSLEPCVMCAFALNIAGVKKVIYGAANERFGGVQFEPYIHQMPPNPYSVRGN